MANIYETISQYIRPYYSKLVILVLLGIFGWVAYYAYGKWGQTKPKANADIYQPSGSKDATVYFFFADWCPHCTKAKPQWATFKSAYDGKEVNGSTIKCNEVDCTDGSSPLIQKYGVNGYPTLIMLKNGDQISFDSKITSDNLTQFVNSI